MNNIRLVFISAGLALLCATGAFAAEYDVLAPLRVEGSYAVFQGTAEVQGSAFSIGGSTFAAQYGKVGIGTSTPAFLLHISSAAGVSGNLLVISTGATDVIRMTGSGDIYANKFYGDISGASGLPQVTGDSLGTHIATATLNMAGFDIVNASSINYMSNVFITSGTQAELGGIYMSSNVYIVGVSSAAKYYGDGSALTGLAGADNLGNHIATATLQMSGFGIVNASSITANYQITTYSTMTVAGSAFSVAGSTFTVSGGKVGIGVAAPAKALEVQNTGTTFKMDTDAGGVSMFIDGIEMVRMKP